MNYYETLTRNTKKDQWKTIRARKRYLRGVGAGFELARRRLRANPSRAFCERIGKVTTGSSARVKV